VPPTGEPMREADAGDTEAHSEAGWPTLVQVRPKRETMALGVSETKRGQRKKAI